MTGRVRFVVMGVLLVLILVGLSGFHRVEVTRFTAGRNVVKVPLGSQSGQAGRATGIDGRIYGPLTFASNGSTTVVSDTYHERLLYFRDGREIRTRPLSGQMVEDLAIDAKGKVLSADNRALTLWQFEATRQKALVKFTHQAGYTEALWHVALSPKHRVLVEWVRIGRGILSTRLDEYTNKGKFIRSLAESRVGRQGLQPLGNTMVPPIKDFQVAPDGNIYVEPQSVQSSDRIIRIYRENGLYMGHIVIRSPEKIKRADFLGISRRGWIYLAVNLNVSHQARVLVANSQGRIITSLHVATVPIHAATYGRVMPSGALLLDQSTPTAYQIRRYQPVTKRVWRWTGF